MLRKVDELPVSTWRYRIDAAEVRHLGPMAQDWWEAFGRGGGDRTISMVDTNGVALACVQALHRLLEESREEVRELRRRVGALTATLRQVARTAVSPSVLDRPAERYGGAPSHDR